MTLICWWGDGRRAIWCLSCLFLFFLLRRVVIMCRCFSVNACMTPLCFWAFLSTLFSLSSPTEAMTWDKSMYFSTCPTCSIVRVLQTCLGSLVKSRAIDIEHNRLSKACRGLIQPQVWRLIHEIKVDNKRKYGFQVVIFPSTKRLGYQDWGAIWMSSILWKE